jgi:hypothetical protein
MQSVVDIIRRRTGHRAPHRDPADILRTLVTLRFAIEKTGLSLDAFARRHVDQPENAAVASGRLNVHKWKVSVTVVVQAVTSHSPSSAHRLQL